MPLSPLHRIHFLTESRHFLLFTRKEIGQFYFLHFSKDERRETYGCKSVCQLSQLAAKGKNLNTANALIWCQVCNGGRKTTEQSNLNRWYNWLHLCKGYLESCWKYHLGYKYHMYYIFVTGKLFQANWAALGYCREPGLWYVSTKSKFTSYRKMKIKLILAISGQLGSSVMVSRATATPRTSWFARSCCCRAAGPAL